MYCYNCNIYSIIINRGLCYYCNLNFDDTFFKSISQKKP